MRTKLITLLIMLACIVGSSRISRAQLPVFTMIGNYNAAAGQPIHMTVKVVNFTDIASISFKLLYSPAVLTYLGDTLIDTTLNTGFLVINAPGNVGMVALAWFSIIPISLADTAVLIGFNFTCLGGSCNLIWDTLGPGNCAYSNISPNYVPGTWINGTVNGGIPSSTCPNSFTYAASGLTTSFVGTVNGGTPPYTYHYTFGDTSYSLVQNPVHTYPLAWDYPVTLVTMDANLCYSVFTDTIPASSFNINIAGDVYAIGALDTGYVELYYSSVLPPVPFQLQDSAYISSAFSFNNIAQGYYILKAQPDTSSAFYLDFLPTYYGNTPYWMNADSIYTSQLNNPYFINLVHVPGPLPGQGNIGGTITSDLKMFSSGVAAPGIELLLTDVNNNVLAVSYSDHLGHFSFNNLAYDTYKVRAEVTLIPVTPVTLTLSAANPNVPALNFNITPSGIVTEVPETPIGQDFNLLSLYPNPASDQVKIEISSSKATALNLECYNLTGQKVLEFNTSLHSGTNHIKISTVNLRKGIYFIRLSTNEGNTLNRKINIY